MICTCTACTALADRAAAANPPGPEATDRPPISGVAFIDALLGGAENRWNDGAGFGTPVAVTYSFMDVPPAYADNEDRDGFAPLTQLQKDGAVAGFALWAEVANISFQPVSDAGAGGQIRLGSNNQQQSSGYAFLPAGDDRPGDIYLANNQDTNNTMTPGSFGFATMVHEIGHAIGLKHPGNYNAGDTSQSPGTPPFLPPDTDNVGFSIMSYNGVASQLNAVGPMLYDIAAVQFLYGANLATRTGDDTYTFAQDAVLGTIWDAGGVDVIDTQALTSPSVIDLNAGAFSSIGTVNGQSVMNNVAIAFNVVIENAVGGAGADRMIGNAAANLLIGGPGADTAVFAGARDAYRIAGISERIYVFDARAGAPDGLDVLVGVETVEFAGQPLSAASLVAAPIAADGQATTGDAADNFLVGGALNDSIRGEGGADTEFGNEGRDVLIGGGGNDFIVADFPANFAFGDADFVDAGDGNDNVFGGGGNDTLFGGGGDDLLAGDSGDNLIFGGDGNNALYGFDGADTIEGGNDGDIVFGLSGPDVIATRAGIDLVIAGGPLDGPGDADFVDMGAGGGSVFAGSGDDTLLADNGDDFMLGESGDDLMSSGAGNDALIAGSGNDTLDAGAGNDVLIAEGGDDVMLGGGGADRFTYPAGIAVGADRIFDFAPGTDKIELAAALGLATGAAALAAVAQAGADALLTLPAGTGTITVVGVPATALSAADFVIV